VNRFVLVFLVFSSLVPAYAQESPRFSVGLSASTNIMAIFTGGFGVTAEAEYAISSHFSVGINADYFGFNSTEPYMVSKYLAFGLSGKLSYYLQNVLSGPWFSGIVGAYLINYTDWDSTLYRNQIKFIAPLLVGYRLILLDTAPLWIDPYMGFVLSIGSNMFTDNSVNVLTGYRFGIGLGYSF
jgi:hypothetical protein